MNASIFYVRYTAGHACKKVLSKTGSSQILIKKTLSNIFSRENPFDMASGETPTWLFMPDDVAEQHSASCLENKRQLLEA
jgi:hypothetical protein